MEQKKTNENFSLSDKARNGPRDGSDPSTEADPKTAAERGVEDRPEPDAGLVRQMSHGDESAERERNSDATEAVGYVDDSAVENRSDDGTREYDAE